MIGPDGTGKSIFALHLASEYWRRTGGPNSGARIIYASSDLSHESAEKVWEAFWLDRPDSRHGRVPFEKGWRGPRIPLNAEEKEEARVENRLKLIRYLPTNDPTDGPDRDDFASFLVAPEVNNNRVAFLDLAQILQQRARQDWFVRGRTVEPAVAVVAHVEARDVVTPREEERCETGADIPFRSSDQYLHFK